jgi:hypothetical protein
MQRYRDAGLKARAVSKSMEACLGRQTTLSQKDGLERYGESNVWGGDCCAAPDRQCPPALNRRSIAHLSADLGRSKGQLELGFLKAEHS